MPLFGFLSKHCQGQLVFAFLFGTGLVCTWHFFSSHQNQNTCPSNGCLTHFLTFLFIHAKQFFFVMFQVKNWLHATPRMSLSQDLLLPLQSAVLYEDLSVHSGLCKNSTKNASCSGLVRIVVSCFFEAVAAASCWL